MKLLPFFFVLSIISPTWAQGLLDLEPHNSKGKNILKNPEHWMGIIGDSGSTGALSSPDTDVRLGSLFKLLGKLGSSQLTDESVEGLKPPTRVLYSTSEWRQALREHREVELNATAKWQLRVDVEENSFGYQIGQGLGIEAQDIVFAAQDGSRVESLGRQFDCLYEMKTETLPPLLFISYNANDLCDQGVFEGSVEDRLQLFRNDLRKSLQSAQKRLLAHPKGTRIFVLAPLDVVQILTSPELLQQEVPFPSYGRVTCGQMRSEKFEAFLAREGQKALQGMCSAVLSTRPSDHERLQRLKEVLSGFRQIWAEEVARQNDLWKANGIQWIYIPEVADIQYQKGDLGNDCFHPGRGAHQKIAEILQRRIQHSSGTL